MPPGDVEVMHGVAKIVPVELHARPGMHHELKRQAALRAVRARLHARLHQALAHMRAIAEFRQMADAVIHSNLTIHSNLDSSLDRIRNIDLVNRRVDADALLLDIGKEVG